MVASVLPDVLLIVLVFIGLISGTNIVSGDILSIYFFMHSVFAILLLLVVAVFSFKYFYALAVGYSLHLILDYLTHTMARIPFYPITEWKAPIFLVSYLDPIFLVSISAILLTVLLSLEGKKLLSFTNSLFHKYRKERLGIFTFLYVMLVACIVILYMASVYSINSPAFFLSSFLVTSNFIIVGYLFLLELDSDENIRSSFRRFVTKLLGRKHTI